MLFGAAGMSLSMVILAVSISNINSIAGTDSTLGHGRDWWQRPWNRCSFVPVHIQYFLRHWLVRDDMVRFLRFLT